MVLCLVDPTFSHDLLVPGAICPQCKERTNPEREHTPSIASVALPTLSRSKTTSERPATIAQQITLPSLFNRTITAANDARSNTTTKSNTSKPPTKSYAPVRFDVHVAHATYKVSSVQAKFTTYPESWQLTISAGTSLSYEQFKQRVEEGGLDLGRFMPHVKAILNPGGQGRWLLASNHLPQKAPSPRPITPWDDDKTIEAIVKQVGWIIPKRKGADYAHPVTLVWYPTYVDPEEEEEFTWQMYQNVVDQEQHYGPQDFEIHHPVAQRQVITLNGGHKRAISDAIPTTERANGRHDIAQEVKDDGDDKAERGSTQKDEAVRGDSDGGPRRSGRARKATMKANDK
jgi:hypothetical protein